MLKEDYVSFEVAKLLKEKRFPQHITSHTYFIGDDKKRFCSIGDFIGHPSLSTDTHLIDAPTLQMAMKWLREVNNIFISIDYSYICGQYRYSICLANSSLNHKNGANIDYDYKTYEEAAEVAIKYCLTKLI